MPCPYCHADPDHDCINERGHMRRSIHSERVVAATAAARREHRPYDDGPDVAPLERPPPTPEERARIHTLVAELKAQIAQRKDIDR